MVEKAKKLHQYFDSLVYEPCIDSEGFRFKSNLKLKSRENKLSMVRVKEKLLKQFIKPVKVEKNCKNIEDLRVR